MSEKGNIRVPAAITGDAVTRWMAFPGGYEEVEVVEPITWEWERIGSRCWRARLIRGRLRCKKSYYLHYYDAVLRGEPVESRSRPPVGRHPVLRLEWRRDHTIMAGSAGHVITRHAYAEPRFLAPGESVTRAGRLVQDQREEA